MTHDLLGLTTGYIPRFAKAYADLTTTITEAVARYCADVASGTFPGAEQTME